MTAGIIHIVEPYLEIAYSGMEIGNLDTRFGSAESVEENRRKLVRVLNPARHILMKLQLGPNFEDLCDAEDEDLEGIYSTDGLFINRPDIALEADTGDCNTIILGDAKHGGIIGVIHAGRQGVDGDIHLAALDNLVKRHGVATGDVSMHFAPSVRKASHYYPTMDPEQLADPKWKKFIKFYEGNHHIDLLARIVKEFTDAGIEPEQMVISPIDTGADERFFSHIRTKREGTLLGRNGTIAMLRSTITL